MRSKPARQAVFEVLAAVALRYGGLEAVTGALAAALSKHEHLAAALAELAAYAEGKFGDSRLVRWTVTWPSQLSAMSMHCVPRCAFVDVVTVTCDCSLRPCAASGRLWAMLCCTELTLNLHCTVLLRCRLRLPSWTLAQQTASPATAA